MTTATARRKQSTPQREAEAVGFHRGRLDEKPTRSGWGQLVPLDDDDARQLVPFDLLISLYAEDGYCPLRVVSVRESMWGESGSMQPCAVITARVAERWPGSGEQSWAFAPEDCYTVSVPKQRKVAA